MEPWVWPIVAMVAVALVGALFKLFGRQTERGESQNAKDIERVEKRLDDHITEDVRMHERLVKVETRQDINDKEVAELRSKTTGMKHDILNSVTQTLMGWYNDIIDKLSRR